MNTTPPIPARVQSAMFLRLLAVQGAWNYETLVGNGIGFCVEPALRLLPGGVDGDAYRAALARQSQYFNAHPYLTAVAVGSLAHAELSTDDPDRIERFRTALCGPLGSVGDRLVWAALLPACSLAALTVFGLGGSAIAVVLTFLGTYNAAHLALRYWGLRVGLKLGMQVASALGAPWLREGPQRIGRVAAVLAGLGIPLVAWRLVSLIDGSALPLVAGAGIVGGMIIRWQGRLEGFKLAAGVLAVLVLYSVTR